MTLASSVCTCVGNMEVSPTYHIVNELWGHNLHILC